MDLNALPKAELHCHLDAILGPDMAQDICRNDPTFPISPATFQQTEPIQDQASFFTWLNVIDPIEGELDNFYPILGRYIEQLKAQNVRYSEIMIASSEIPRDVGAALEKLGAFREWVNQQEGDEIQVEFLAAFARTKSVAEMAELAERLLPLYGAGLIVGVALAGPETGNPVKPFRRTFARFHEAGLGIEIHAGEWCGPESVWDALEYGYPDRIGHGVSIFQDARLLDAVRERDIHLEMCLSSNLKTGSVPRIEDHPVAKARDLGISFSINTDDPGPFECSMTSEYRLLSKVFGFEAGDLQRIYLNSLEARFQSELRIDAFTGLGSFPQ